MTKDEQQTYGKIESVRTDGKFYTTYIYIETTDALARISVTLDDCSGYYDGYLELGFKNEDLIGEELIDITCDNKRAGISDEVEDTSFVEIRTNKAVYTITAYCLHNGYYGTHVDSWIRWRDNDISNSSRGIDKLSVGDGDGNMENKTEPS